MALKKPGAKPVRPASIKPAATIEAVEVIVKEEEKPKTIKKTNIKKEVPKEEVVEQEIIVENTVEEVVVENIEPVKEEPQEVVEEQPKEETVEEKPVAKKKSTRKKTTKKSEVKTDTEEPQEIKEEKIVLPNMSLEECLETMIKKVNATTADWEEEKATISEEIEGLIIDPDASPGEMKELISQIDILLSKLKILKANCEQRNNGLLEHIEYIKYKGSTGSNSEERKTNGMEALMHYMVDPDAPNSANLLELKVFITNQSNFYNEMINVLVDKKNLLITFSGLTKIEAQLGGY